MFKTLNVLSKTLNVTSNDFSMSHPEQKRVAKFRTLDITFITLSVMCRGGKVKGHCWHRCHVPSDLDWFCADYRLFVMSDNTADAQL